MADMQITNLTANQYAFGPYVLNPNSSVTIDTTTNASLYLTDDHFTDIVNQLVALGYASVTNPPTPFPRVTGVPQLLHGDGSPEGVLFATQGSAFMRRDNSGSNNALYAKTTGPSLSSGWQAFAGAPGPSTTLPGSPGNAQQAILVDSVSAPTYAWHLQYSTPAAKWVFIGGFPMYAEVQTVEACTVTAYGALATAGPSVTLPVAGTYDVEIGAWFQGATGAAFGYMSYDIGGTGAADADAVAGTGYVSSNMFNSGSRKRRKSGLTAVTLTTKYKAAAVSGINIGSRYIAVTPVLLG
jgi:hypothetical protein